MPDTDDDWQSKDPTLTKLRAAELQVLASVQMAAAEVHPLSVHLVVISADEVIQAIAKHRGKFLPYADDVMIKPEFKREWYQAKKRAANFVKHADVDPEGIYDGPKVSSLVFQNDMRTMMNIIGLNALGVASNPSLLFFYSGVLFAYPDYINWHVAEAIYPPDQLEKIRDVAEARHDRSVFMETLRVQMNRAGLYPRPIDL